MNVISHGSISIIKSKVIYHKKSLDLVTVSFLLRVITVLSDLSSATEPSGLFQPRLIGPVVFCSDKEFTLFCLSVDSSFQFKAITGTSLCYCTFLVMRWFRSLPSAQQACRSFFRVIYVGSPLKGPQLTTTATH